MIPCLIFCMLADHMSLDPLWLTVNHWLALIIFLAASITDAVDGYLARKHDLVTNFGRLIDPLADKLLVVSAFVAFVELDMFPAWLVIVVLCREFIVTGLRTLGVSQQRVIHADWWGKHKTVSQMITLGAALFLLAVDDTMTLYHGLATSPDDVLNILGDGLITILICYCLFFTVVSGVMYCYRNRDLLFEQD